MMVGEYFGLVDRMEDYRDRHFAESNTYQNLLAAFAGETSASGKYAIFGLKAKEEGYEQIGDIFMETSANEREHGELWYKVLHGGEIPPTVENLTTAFQGEHQEWSQMYREYAQEAAKEGYPEIAKLFLGVAAIEHHHDERYRALARNIHRNEVFCKQTKVVWICLNCGNLYYGECAPEICPVCEYPQGYYQMNCENY